MCRSPALCPYLSFEKRTKSIFSISPNTFFCFTASRREIVAICIERQHQALRSLARLLLRQPSLTSSYSELRTALEDRFPSGTLFIYSVVLIGQCNRCVVEVSKDPSSLFIAFGVDLSRKQWQHRRSKPHGGHTAR